MQHSFKQFFILWLALMALLGLTFGSAFLQLGAWNSLINLVVAAIKAGLVMLFFMHLRRASALIRIYAGVGLFVLLILFAVSASDYATRDMHAAPWQAPAVPSAVHEK